MTEVLPLSRAARAAGVSRTTLQAKIEAGELTSFEGMVRLADLIRVFPSAREQESPEIQRMQQIKEAALTKPLPADSPAEFGALRAVLERQQTELEQVRAEAETYRQIIDTLADKLLEVQESCDERQRVLLQTVISWLFTQVKPSQR